MMKYSKQREFIYDAICRETALGCHVTVDRLYEIVKPEMPMISLGTIYRNLRILENGYRIRKVVVPEGNDRYESRLEAHDHLLCTCCGKIVDMVLPKTIDFADFAQEKGFLLQDHILLLKGVCAECKKKIAEE